MILEFPLIFLKNYLKNRFTFGGVDIIIRYAIMLASLKTRSVSRLMEDL